MMGRRIVIVIAAALGFLLLAILEAVIVNAETLMQRGALQW